MTVEPIGILVVLCGLLTLRQGPRFGVYILAVTAVLGAAAAIKLPMLGDASVPPSHVVLVFLIVAVALQPRGRAEAFGSLAFPGSGFLLLAAVGYGVLTAVFLPRIFADLTHVYSIARSGEQIGIITAPLAPRASNVTQTAYLLGDLICFIAVAAVARLGGAETVARAAMAGSMLILVFAFADFATYHTGTSEFLSPIRNSNYRLLEDGEISGFKRIVGSFAEASAYGYAALGSFAFTLRLWLAGLWPRLAAVLALLLLATILLCTSTTAYVATALHSLLTLVGCALRAARRTATQRDLVFLAVAPTATLALILGLMLAPSLWDLIISLYDTTISNKLDTQSGIERTRWNQQALQSFLDTAGLGAGVGSVRASSFPVALLANVGVIGTLIVIAFLGSVILPPRRDVARSPSGAISRAGASACLALTIAAFISAGGVDLGLPFFIFAAVAATPAARPLAFPAPSWLSDRAGAIPSDA